MYRSNNGGGAPAESVAESVSNSEAARILASKNSGVTPQLARLGYRFVKRAFDICFSLLIILIALIPSLILCVFICAESPGSPLFSQERIGKNGKPFRILKFRTMVSDAHGNVERYLTPEEIKDWRRNQKVDNDPRVTRIGKFLRRISLDEIPQFINVLKGDMSTVGPRPVTLEETYEFGSNRDELLSCKPGITGWWQVTDRNDATWENQKRQLEELYYVRHASLALDAKIFFLTFSAMFGKRNGR